MTVHDDEAKTVRDAHATVLKGTALYSIAAQWDKAGILTMTGRQWISATLRRMLINPRCAGLRSYRGEILKDGDAKAQWPTRTPVVDSRSRRSPVRSASAAADPHVIQTVLVTPT
jgi:site-specific DNA recombinase